MIKHFRLEHELTIKNFGCLKSMLNVVGFSLHNFCLSCSLPTSFSLVYLFFLKSIALLVGCKTGCKTLSVLSICESQALFPLISDMLIIAVEHFFMYFSNF